MSSLDSNAVVQVLGLEHENPYVKETFLFFYVLAIIRDVKGTKNFVHTLFISLLRSFGSYGFALPLVLGALPSKTYQNFDSYLVTLLAGLFVTNFLADKLFPKDVWKHIQKPADFAYNVIKGNAAGHGYVMVQAALPDSVVAPFVGAFLAVNGHRIVEKGFSSLAVSTYDGDLLLGTVGGLFYYALIEYVRVSSLVARVFLIIFRISACYVDYNSIIDNVWSAIGSTGARVVPKSPKRGRSRTPMRK